MLMRIPVRMLVEDDIGPTRQKSEPGMALRGVFGTPSTPGADVTKEAADGFGPLKTLLRSISLVSPKHDVRLKFLVSNPHLTKSSAGIRHHQK